MEVMNVWQILGISVLTAIVFDWLMMKLGR
jgi:hypothetical protein